ncbi:DNA-3-methyladenine glycosylase I [Nesterenkonia alkaliphila]|uniref:DNA-3-methyladenine glycosylase I n=1 Tax=Nesterenkonia alkaliphila TaxID=1463631 RepID=A0A7K1UMA2_9MICC|nr:DNA-3-methyladenine glycosylase I [Nesterenkonia alkaliphila]MVT27593.1 DNA-3-methyladenine glycosylase I [Nesterenkonia alkaliphila]GFZ79828.1 DNA-3-methyladenine glycosylase I [Nesterenkonia alkaliphila]
MGEQQGQPRPAPHAATVASDGLPRCLWSVGTPDLLNYHDTEWGFPVGTDRALFEKLCLESFQSGLSWRTVLAKRESFRSAFHGFEIARVARLTEDDVARLLQDPGIIRHRGKIAAVINNARRAEELLEQQESLAAFAWSFEPEPEGLAAPQTASTSAASVTMSKELKRRGWQFLGPTTVFAFMQAMGLINDHVHGCTVRSTVEKARAGFSRP